MATCQDCGGRIGDDRPSTFARHRASAKHARGGLLRDRLSTCPTCGRGVRYGATCYHRDTEARAGAEGE